MAIVDGHRLILRCCTTAWASEGVNRLAVRTNSEGEPSAPSISASDSRCCCGSVIPGLRAQILSVRAGGLIIGPPPGGSADITARLMSQCFRNSLTNRSSSKVVLARAPISPPKLWCMRRSDGYTLLLVAPANAINATLYENLSLNFIRDIVAVGRGSHCDPPLVVAAFGPCTGGCCGCCRMRSLSGRNGLEDGL
jgi:hypothetical protein